MLSGDGMDLLASELLRRRSGRPASLREKPVQTIGPYNPKQQQLVIGILKTVPGILGDIDRSTSLKGVRRIIEHDGSSAFEYVEVLFHLKVQVNRYACASLYLLGSTKRALRPKKRMRRSLPSWITQENDRGRGQVESLQTA